jgi:hypothetical protein
MPCCFQMVSTFLRGSGTVSQRRLPLNQLKARCFLIWKIACLETPFSFAVYTITILFYDNH